MHHRRILLAAAMLLLLPLAARAQAPAPDLVQALRQGGLVLVWRHPATHNDQADTNPFDLADCARQRQLNDTGRQQSRDLGAAFRAAGIPVSAVLTSPFCRAKDAAALTGLGPVTVDNDIGEGGLVVPPNENQRRARALRALLGTTPAGGGNALIISHRPNVMDAVGRDAFDIAEAEIFVFRPQAEAPGFRLIGRLPAAAWKALGPQ